MVLIDGTLSCPVSPFPRLPPFTSGPSPPPAPPFLACSFSLPSSVLSSWCRCPRFGQDLTLSPQGSMQGSGNEVSDITVSPFRSSDAEGSQGASTGSVWNVKSRRRTMPWGTLGPTAAKHGRRDLPTSAAAELVSVTPRQHISRHIAPLVPDSYRVALLLRMARQPTVCRSPKGARGTSPHAI